jgi:hypothetical protein
VFLTQLRRNVTIGISGIASTVIVGIVALFGLNLVAPAIAGKVTKAIAKNAGHVLNALNPFDSGPDGDVKATGSVGVGKHTPRTATNTFAVRIGDGTTIVSIKAHQNWDKHGSIFNGDFQSTNGTASVRDPDDHGSPASIEVGVAYCATGTLTRTSQVDDSGKAVDSASDKVTFDMGALYVCDVNWLPTAKNEAAFNQDDTPNSFQGSFEQRIKGAGVAAVKGSECPKSMVGWYTSPAYLEFAAGALAKQLGVPVQNVTVLPGKQGTTPQADQGSIRASLNEIVKNDQLDINYFSGGAEAIVDSCYIDLGAVPLESLAKNPPIQDRNGL